MGQVGVALFFISALIILAGFLILIIAIFSKPALKIAGYTLMIGLIFMLASLTLCSIGHYNI